MLQVDSSHHGEKSHCSGQIPEIAQKTVAARLNWAGGVGGGQTK